MNKITFILIFFTFNNLFAVIPVTDIGATTQLISSVANQAVIIENQYQMLKGIGKDGVHVSDFTDTVNKVKSISDSGLAVSYATKDLKSKFNKVFGEAGSYKDQQDKHNQSMLDSALNTFKTASEQLSYVEQQAGAVSTITNASNGSTGVLAVAQGTNQLINATNSQLQSLTAMQAQRNSLLATNIAEQASKNKMRAKQAEKTFAFADTYKPYYSDPRFARMPII